MTKPPHVPTTTTLLKKHSTLFKKTTVPPCCRVASPLPHASGMNQNNEMHANFATTWMMESRQLSRDAKFSEKNTNTAAAATIFQQSFTLSRQRALSVASFSPHCTLQHQQQQQQVRRYSHSSSKPKTKKYYQLPRMKTANGDTGTEASGQQHDTNHHHQQQQSKKRSAEVKRIMKEARHISENYRKHATHKRSKSEKSFQRQKDEFLRLLYSTSRFPGPDAAVEYLIVSPKWMPLMKHHKVLLITTYLSEFRKNMNQDVNKWAHRDAFRYFQIFFLARYIPFRGLTAWNAGSSTEPRSTIFLPQIILAKNSWFEPYVELMSILLKSYRTVQSLPISSEEEQEEGVDLSMLTSEEERQQLLTEIFERGCSVWKSFMEDMLDYTNHGNAVGNFYLELLCRHGRLEESLEFMRQYCVCSLNSLGLEDAFITLHHPGPYVSLMRIASEGQHSYDQYLPDEVFNSFRRDFPHCDEGTLRTMYSFYGKCLAHTAPGELIHMLQHGIAVHRKKATLSLTQASTEANFVSSLSPYDETCFFLLNDSFSVQAMLKEMLEQATQLHHLVPLIQELIDLYPTEYDTVYTHNLAMRVLVMYKKPMDVKQYFEHHFYISDLDHEQDQHKAEEVRAHLPCNGQFNANYESFLYLLQAISSAQYKRVQQALHPDESSQSLFHRIQAEFESIVLYIMSRSDFTSFRSTEDPIPPLKILNSSIALYSNYIAETDNFSSVIDIFTQWFISSYNEDTVNNYYTPNMLTYHYLFMASLMNPDPDLQAESLHLTDVIFADAEELGYNSEAFIERALRQSLRESNLSHTLKLINTFYCNPMNEDEQKYNHNLLVMQASLLHSMLDFTSADSNNALATSDTILENPVTLFEWIKDYAQYDMQSYEKLMDWIIRQDASKLPQFTNIVSDYESFLNMDAFNQDGVSDTHTQSIVITSKNRAHLEGSFKMTTSHLNRLMGFYATVDPIRAIGLFRSFCTPPAKKSNDITAGILMRYSKSIPVQPDRLTIFRLLHAYHQLRYSEAFNQTLRVYMENFGRDRSMEAASLLRMCLQKFAKESDNALNVDWEYYVGKISNDNSVSKLRIRFGEWLGNGQHEETKKSTDASNEYEQLFEKRDRL